MKAIKLIIAANMFSGIAFAQTVEFIEPRNIMGVARPEISTFKMKENTYVLYQQYDMDAPLRLDLQLDVYDANMKPIGSNAIDKSLEQNDLNYYNGIFPLSDKLVMFKSGWSKATGNVLNYYPMTPNGVRQAGKELCSFTAEKMMNSGDFHVNVSADGSKIVVLCELPIVKDSLEHTMIYVYDNNFKELWKKDYRFPNANGTEKYRYNDIYVSNSGSVFDMKRVPVHKALDYFTVFTFFNNGAKVEERKMDLGQDGHIASYKTAFCSNGDLIFSGYYYPDKKAGINVETPSGAFYIKVSAVDGGMPVDKTTPITPDAAIKANYLLLLPDNSAILVGENEYTTSTLKPNVGTTAVSQAYDYDYNNTRITATKFGSDGVKKWEQTINRDVKSRNDGGRTLGIFACMMGDNLVITYQDYLYMHDGKSHVIVDPIYGSYRVDVIHKINADGIMVSDVYVNDKRMAGRDSEYSFLPTSGSKINDTTLFFVGTRGLELVAVKVTL